MQTLDWDDFINGVASDASVTGAANPPSAMTIGVFDGVHRGHQSLIRKVVEHGSCPTVITFRENPKQTLAPQTYAGDIITLHEKLIIFERMGVKKTILIDFSDDFRCLKGREFIEVLIYQGNLRFLVVGYNFRCGCCLDTDAQAVKSITAEHGVACEVVEPIMFRGERVSSSRIRAALRAGDWVKAAAFLGREPVDPRLCFEIAMR
ncbi:MAG: FAD synthetase family protein [Treponema sp.]|jgi:FAD synthase|nr:FAD synthetase family protein [Treponema sp.]